MRDMIITIKTPQPDIEERDSPGVRKVRPSEASAVAVLRELMAWDRWTMEPTLPAIIDHARRVLGALGPDPMPVVRAACRYLDYGPDGRLGPAWVGFREAVDAYRKAGGK